MILGIPGQRGGETLTGVLILLGESGTLLRIRDFRSGVVVAHDGGEHRSGADDVHRESSAPGLESSRIQHGTVFLKPQCGKMPHAFRTEGYPGEDLLPSVVSPCIGFIDLIHPECQFIIGRRVNRCAA